MTEKIPGIRLYSGLVMGQKSPEWWNALRPKFENLWASGLSTRLIGLEIGVTKNAVIGKAGRWNLPSRGNIFNGKNPGTERQRNSDAARTATIKAAPIKTEAVADNYRPPSPPEAPTRRPDRGPAMITPRPVIVAYPAASMAVMAPPPPPSTPRPPLPMMPPVIFGGIRTCQEIVGHASGVGFDFIVPFCGAKSVPGRPYCATHCAKNYMMGRRSGPPAPFIRKLYSAGAGKYIVDEDAA